MFPYRSTLWLTPLLSLGVVLIAGQAGQPSKAVAEAKDDAEVLFANGSTVRMALVQDAIEVLTRYGKLSVPLAEVQRIEFGVHLPPDVARKVDDAIGKLASVQYGEREDGTKELTALGASAYPALLRALKSGDQEVVRRAEKVLTAIRAAVPEKDLRGSEEDIIYTPGFTIVGRILTPALSGKSEYFGDVKLQLTQMRHLRSLKGPGDVQVVVDAGQHGSAHGQWMDTGLAIESTSTLLIVASGTIDIYPQSPGQYLSTPKGYGNIALAAGAKVIPTPANMRNYAGALFGRVGDGGEAFYIGDRYEGAPGREGKLYLHIVPSPWNNASSGSYQVKIASRN
jgi:hypothetical protein